MANANTKRTLKKADVLRATQIPLHTFQHWMDRRVVKLSGEDVPAPKGKARGFSMRRVNQIAIAHRISLLGIPAATAVALAATFTDKPQAGREIGQPFKTGKTLIVATPDGQSKIVHVEADQDMTTHFQDATLAVDVGQIINETLSRIVVIK